ncbi:MAG: DUF4870 domain-containing protein [Glaciecola sp.]|jgi:uncharacterized Tic20 family protein|nr:DUF4870 domain-containing protein [Glaciecola sp.]MDG1468252.1 DUF4870 domain-containing protein [Glaciecola sp.]
MSSSQISQLPVATESKDAKNSAMVMWLSSIFFGIFSGLLFSFMLRSEPYVQSQAKEAINWGVTMLVLTIVILMIFGAAVIPVVLLLNMLFALMGAIASSIGAKFAVPMTVRLLK